MSAIKIFGLIYLSFAISVFNLNVRVGAEAIEVGERWAMYETLIKTVDPESSVRRRSQSDAESIISFADDSVENGGGGGEDEIGRRSSYTSDNPMGSIRRHRSSASIKFGSGTGANSISTTNEATSLMRGAKKVWFSLLKHFYLDRGMENETLSAVLGMRRYCLFTGQEMMNRENVSFLQFVEFIVEYIDGIFVEGILLESRPSYQCINALNSFCETSGIIKVPVVEIKDPDVVSLSRISCPRASSITVSLLAPFPIPGGRISGNGNEISGINGISGISGISSIGYSQYPISSLVPFIQRLSNLQQVKLGIHSSESVRFGAILVKNLNRTVKLDLIFHPVPSFSPVSKTLVVSDMIDNLQEFSSNEWENDAFNRYWNFPAITDRSLESLALEIGRTKHKLTLTLHSSPIKFAIYLRNLAKKNIRKISFIHNIGSSALRMYLKSKHRYNEIEDAFLVDDEVNHLIMPEELKLSHFLSTPKVDDIFFKESSSSSATKTITKSSLNGGENYYYNVPDEFVNAIESLEFATSNEEILTYGPYMFPLMKEVTLLRNLVLGVPHVGALKFMDALFRNERLSLMGLSSLELHLYSNIGNVASDLLWARIIISISKIHTIKTLRLIDKRPESQNNGVWIAIPLLLDVGHRKVMELYISTSYSMDLDLLQRSSLKQKFPHIWRCFYNGHHFG